MKALMYLASTNLKPFQGLKLHHIPPIAFIQRASTNLKPFQGLKQRAGNLGVQGRCFNQPKTLSGIETGQVPSEEISQALLQPT